MSDDTTTQEVNDLPMHHRAIILADGRYMIFYTFGNEEPLNEDRADDKGEDV